MAEGSAMEIRTRADRLSPLHFPQVSGVEILISRSQKRASEKNFRKSLAAAIRFATLLRPAHCRGFAKKPRSRGFFVA
jgi:hypothetical protein